MLPVATYRQMLDYLLRLGQRHLAITRAEYTLTGEPSENAIYPLVLVEIDTQATELIRPDNTPTGLDAYTFAIQVLDTPARADTDIVPDLLASTGDWASQLTEQLRQELPGQLTGVNRLALPGVAGTDLATGWRLELQVKLAKTINRTTNGSLFAPL